MENRPGHISKLPGHAVPTPVGISIVKCLACYEQDGRRRLCLKGLLIFLLFFYFSFSGAQNEQVDSIQGLKLIYSEANRQLNLDFAAHASGDVVLDAKRYPGLRSLHISNYGATQRSQLLGLENMPLEDLAFIECSVKQFCSLHTLPGRVRSLQIWEDHVSLHDTIVIPREIEQLQRLRTMSVGCCHLISLQQIDLAKLKNLDTLILEGPLYEAGSLTRLRKLEYLGLWKEATDINYGWKTDSLYRVIDSLLPRVKKAIWCFPPGQLVMLYNKTLKRIESLSPGDTLLSYDPASGCFEPNPLLEVVCHPEQLYPICTLHPHAGLLASSGHSFPVTLRTVKATPNHPIVTEQGPFPLGQLDDRRPVFYLDNSDLKHITVRQKESGLERTMLYNLITSRKSYFVNGYLFADK